MTECIKRKSNLHYCDTPLAQDGWLNMGFKNEYCCGNISDPNPIIEFCSFNGLPYKNYHWEDLRNWILTDRGYTQE